MTVHALTPLAPLRGAPATPDPRGFGGLLALVQGREQALPLEAVRVRASIAGIVARTEITQTFHNPSDSPVEAVHIFPLPEQGAVIGLDLIAGDLVVRAECRPRREAERVFDEARQAGHRAALLSAERDDVHTLRVTRLPPGERVQVRITVVEALPVVDGRVRWRFPTVVAPRFIPGAPISHSGPGVAPDTDLVPDASRIQPPIRLEGGTCLDLQVSVAGPVRSLASSLHAVQMQLGGDGVVVAPAGTASCDRDFVLAIGSAEPDALGTQAWTDGRTTLALVSPPMERLPVPLPRDAIFVIDVSGSMSGRKMDAARRALKTALHGLLPGDRFRLIAFDHELHPATPDLVPYTQAEVERADRWIDRLHDQGGTQMYAPIVEALTGGSPTPSDRLRTVLFITDGQAGDEDRLAQVVAMRGRGARFFTLGIDTAVNGALLERLARIGGGSCELLTPMDDIEGAVALLEARFGSPILERVQVDGHELASRRHQAVFAGRPASLLLSGSPRSLRITGTSPDGPWSAEVRPRKVDFDFTPLWARRRVASLEDQLITDGGGAEATRAAITELGVEHQIATRYTSFVAVERSREIEGELVEVVQPVEQPHAWEQAQPDRMMTGAMPPPAAPMPSMQSAPAGPSPRRAKRRASPRAEKAGVFSAIARGLGFGRADSSQDDAEELEAVAFNAKPEDDLAPAPPELAAPESASEIGAFFAQLQGFDGGFGGVEETAAALLALVLLGHTRRTGVRQRTVLKATRFLQASSPGFELERLVRLVTDALHAAERDEQIRWVPEFDVLVEQGAIGGALARARALSALEG